jgi:hypothetical protein
MRARTGLWEPRAGNDPGPPGLRWCGSERETEKVSRRRLPVKETGHGAPRKSPW